MYRYERQLKCVEKAEKMAQDAGFAPQAVPPKILFPLLEGASFEENEELHTMWAALLANAASPANCEKVRPGYIALLKQMSPDEAGTKSLPWSMHLEPTRRWPRKSRLRASCRLEGADRYRCGWPPSCTNLEPQGRAGMGGRLRSSRPTGFSSRASTRRRKW
jgi:hypothetical protein